MRDPCLPVPDVLFRCLRLLLGGCIAGCGGQAAAAAVRSESLFTQLGICLLRLSHAELHTSFYFPEQLEIIQEG